MKLGIVGLGVTGGALERYLQKHGHQILGDDPAKDRCEDLALAQAIFICVPVPTLKKGIQDFSILKAVLKKYQKLERMPIYLRSTILPKTTDNLAKQFKMRLYAMPEFLTERNADQSMADQDLVCGVEDHPQCWDIQETFLHAVFPDKEIVLMSNREAELAKYAHNCAAAMKVNFFNLIRKYADAIRADYNHVIDGVIQSRYINHEHTQVPGPDGKSGFGGKCFPKDLLAFRKEAERMGLQTGSILCAEFENYLYRTERDRVKAPLISFPEEFTCGE